MAHVHVSFIHKYIMFPSPDDNCVQMCSQMIDPLSPPPPTPRPKRGKFYMLSFCDTYQRLRDPGNAIKPGRLIAFYLLKK